MIYKITNTVNSKAYVGYSGNVSNRLHEHKNGYGSKVVYAAIQKYGVDNFTFEILAEDTVDNEDMYIQEHDTMTPNGYNLVAGGGLPPTKQGWKPSAETLAKRSASLKGIVRTEEWCKNLSESKSGKNNPRYGIKEPCTEERRLAVLRGKNAPNYNTYKKAIALMDNGKSAGTVSKELSVGRGVCFKLKNRTHGIFQAFPELI
jgi:group I intron endonuclease|tara:strand:- start:30 stop:638 length:609 start_codon:yes stop_codon:yes gene_type:complete